MLIEGLMIGGGFLASVSVTAISTALVSPLFKNALLHDPNNPDKFALFVRAGTGRMVAIDFGGTFYYDIDGDKDGPVDSSGVWGLFRRYIWATTRLHPFFPYFTEPFSYDLPRYEVREQGGKRVYIVIDENSPKYRTNHVRTAPFTWNFEFSGAEIQRIPFLIKGSAQVRIAKEKIKDALYLTESWNVLLDQAITSVTRSVVRGEVDLDMVIGKVEKSLWTNSKRSTDAYTTVTQLIMARLQDYEFDTSFGDEFAGKKLADLGIIVLKIDITDFEDELPEAEKTRLRAGVLGREAGRSNALELAGTAEGQRKVREAHGDGTGASPDIINADALVRAAEKSDVGALVAALIGQIQNRK